MKKNYPQLSSCFKPGFFLVVFLLFGFYANAQRILNVEHNLTSICTGEVLDFQFRVRNGGGGTYGFDTETVYKVEVVYTFRQNNTMYYTPVSSFNFTNKQGPPKQVFEERIIYHSISLNSDIPSRNDYQLLITATNPQIPARPEGISTQTFEIIANNNQTYTETETGTNYWIGHVYDGTNQNQTIDQNFNNYVGGYTEDLSFDQNFGGNQNDFQLGTGSCAPSVYTETFAVRYRMNSSLTGLYYMNIGSDDGTRLSVDGELVYNDWNDHAYRNQNILMRLSGNSNLVLDYYENGGGNRVSVGEPQLLIENILSNNLTQTLNSQNPGQAITGDEFNGLPNGMSRFGSGYQWFYSTTENGETIEIPGATNPNFTPNRNITPFNNEGTYYIYRIATLTSSNNRLGSAYRASVKSNPAVITVEKSIDIINQPTDVTTCTGSIVDFSVNVIGVNLSYQWQRNDGGNSQNFFNIGNNGNFQNTRSATLSVIGNETWLDNKRFRVIITDANGNSVISNSALLSLNQSPQGINTQPKNEVVCEGNDISFQTYTSNNQRQWQVSEDNGSSWSNLSNSEYYQNVNGERLDIINTPANFDQNLYRIEVSNQKCSVYSNSAALQVDVDPITRQPRDVTAEFGDNAVIEAGVSGSNLSYQWQTFSSNWYNIDNGEHYSGTKTKRLELISVGYFPVDGSRYRLLVTNQNGCVSISETAFLNVNENQCQETPTVSLNAPTTICTGQTNIIGTLTGTGPWNIEASINGRTFNLNLNERNFSYPIDIQQNTNIEILNISDANGCENNAPDARVTINVVDEITNNTITGTQESCGSLDPGQLTGSDLGNEYSYIWESSTTNSTSGFSAAIGNNNESNYTPGTLTETTWYRRKINVQNCNESISNVIKITVNSNIKNNNISFFHGNSGKIQATANENQQLSISAPAGTVFTCVDFASYGTPINNAGNFSINEECHATTSQVVTESYLIGENSATIPATNGVFTDPCVGTFKRLSVEATYSQAFCKGIDPGTVAGSPINGNNITYTWQLSTEGPASAFAPAPGNNNQQNYNPGILNESIWLKRVVNSGSCSSESQVLFIPVIEENTWTGTENTNWNNTNNWSCNSLPTLETNVLIPESLASGNYPEITAGNNALAKDLTIESNASVEVTDNWLRIAGNLTNNGILNTETGSVSFEGTSAQIIPNSAFENNRIQNLQIDNPSGVTSQAIIEITGTIKVEDGNLDTGNELTLISNENQTALIDGSGNGEVIGLVSMQRYLDKAFGYKYFSSPFQNSVVVDFAPFMDFSDPESGFPHFYRYEENRRVDSLDLDATGWEAYIEPTNTLNVSEGYALNFGTSSAPQTIELIGEVNNGSISSGQLENNHREYTKGFHLVGNPYPSPIDWNAANGWTRDNIDDGIYFFTASDDNQYTGTYTAFVNDISTGDSNVDGSSENIIPSMQGFFIKVSDSDTQDLITGSFGMDNRVRTNNFNQEFYRSQITDQKSLLRLEAGFKGANRKDAMVIYFSSYATPNFEKEMDAHKLMNTDPAVPSFYNITTDKKELAINAIPFPESRSYKKIPLGIKADQNGPMQINLASIENLSPNFNVYLIDHTKSIGQNLSRDPEYTFNIKAGTHNSRFELMFSEEEVPSPAIAFNEPFDVKVENGNVVIELNLEESQQGVLRASTITGQILQIKQGRGKDQVIFDGITSDGVYIINLQVGKERHAKKVVIKK